MDLYLIYIETFYLTASFNYIKNIMKENKLYLSYEIKEKNKIKYDRKFSN